MLWFNKVIKIKIFLILMKLFKKILLKIKLIKYTLEVKLVN